MRGSRWEKRSVHVAAKERPPGYNEVKAMWEVTIVKEARTQRLPDAAKAWAWPIGLGFYWYEKDRHRDPDGVSSGGKKLLLDGLVKAGVLPTDGAAHIHRFRSSEFRYGMGEGVSVGFFDGACVDKVIGIFLFPHRLPDRNELDAAREVAGRRDERKALARRNFDV